MKKRFLVTALTIALVVVCAFGLFACAQKTDGQTPSTPNTECTHSYGQWTSDGDSTHSRKCSKCGNKETQAHQANGDKCGVCGYTFTTEIHTRHSFTNYVYNNDATCTADGTETAKCDGCNERDTRTKINTKLSHSFTDYQSNNDWTCTQDGTKTAKCDYCNERDTIADIGSAKHMPKTAVKENEVEPTYETDGSYDWVVRCYKCNEVISSEHITVGKLMPSGTEIRSKSLTVEGDSIYGKFANGTELFRFAGDITVADGASYYLCTDILGTQVIPTKIAPLQSGDNTFYIVVVNGNDDPMTYTVTLRVRPMYTVTFNANGGSAVQSQTVEEDDFAEVPTTSTSRTGYTFDKWDYDFTQPIMSNTRISAIWTANTYTATLDVNGGDDLEQSEISIDYDDYFTFATPTRTGYTFNGWYDGDTRVSSMTWKYAENKTFVADWSANRYYLTLTNTDTAAGTITKSGYYYYDDTVILTATNKDGYNFEGWYDTDDNLLCENAEYSYTMGLNATLQAKWNYYTVSTAINYSAAGKVTTAYDNKKVTAGNSVTVTATDNQYLGYTWLGWYNDNNELLSNEFSYTFTMAKENTTCIATWQVWQGLEVFDFSSTKTTLKITGLKDKTLPEVTIPNYVTDISDGVFYGCDNLAIITVQDGSAKYHSDGNCIIDTATKTLVAGCKNSVIPDDGSVTSIGNYAFEGCRGLTSIEIPNSVTYIGMNAFYGCRGLTSIVIPNSVTGIGYGAFSYCSSLTSIEIPDSATKIWSTAFDGCSSIISATMPTTAIGYIPKTKLKTVVINGGTSIGDYAFGDCSSLTSITIPNSVTSIGRGAFEGCSSLTCIEIPNGVTSIGDYAFNYCSSLTSVNS